MHECCTVAGAGSAPQLDTQEIKREFKMRESLFGKQPSGAKEERRPAPSERRQACESQRFRVGPFSAEKGSVHADGLFDGMEKEVKCGNVVKAWGTGGGGGSESGR